MILKFAVKDTAHELDLTLERLETFIQLREIFSPQETFGGAGLMGGGDAVV